MDKNVRKYPLDSSALVHLASKTQRYTNTFRLSATLKEDISPTVLQNALVRITPRFPLIVAGIQRGNRQYMVVPADVPPQVQPEREYLAYMPDKMLHSCAMRVLYRGKNVSVEIFHGLTDGYGGLSFLTALVTEYVSLAYGVSVGDSSQSILPAGTLADDYITYAGKPPVSFWSGKVYRLPGSAKNGQAIHSVTGICDLQQLLNTAHSFNVSLTAFLTAVMASSVAELQARYCGHHQPEPVQIMVPVNLRTRFQSVSMRNFTLYALVKAEPKQAWMPVGVLAQLIGGQLKQQLSQERLAGMMATNVKLQQSALVQKLPLGIKECALRIGHHFLGEGNSCLSLSNLGSARFPKELLPFVTRVEFMMTPRRNAPYNCGVTSYNGTLYINFSRRGDIPELEKVFFQQLAAAGCHAAIEIDGVPTRGAEAWMCRSRPGEILKKSQSKAFFNKTQTILKQTKNTAVL